MSLISEFLASFPDAKEAANGWMARCPAHEDGNASLSISEGQDGRVLVHCHAGCTAEAVVKAVGLTLADLYVAASYIKQSRKSPKSGKSAIEAVYDYPDETGTLLFQVVRMIPKTFRQRRPMPGGKWEWSVKGVRQVPYRLREFLANPSRLVAVVEGEKDVDNLAKIDVLATCNAGGGKYARKGYTVNASFEDNLIATQGQELVDWLKGPHELKHYTEDQLKAIEAEHAAKARELQKALV